MVDTCIQAVEWTLNGNKPERIEKEQSNSRDEDSIFIEAKCEAQNVTLKYIFSADSDFEIDDKTLKLEVEAFTKNEECQPEDGEGEQEHEVMHIVIHI